MQLVYGNYRFQVDSTRVGSETEPLFDDAMRPYAYRVKCKIHGMLLGSSGDMAAADRQTELSLLENEMRAAFLIPNQKLSLTMDNGADSSVVLDPLTSTSGVIVTMHPSMPSTHRNEFATQREFNIEAMAEYAMPNTVGRITKFTESLSFSGGGPLRIARPCLNALPQIQIVYRFQPYQCVQQGAAEGYTTTPPVPPPLWPANLISDPEITLTTPQRIGNTYQKYSVSWKYSFISATPMVGSPNLWPL